MQINRINYTPQANFGQTYNTLNLDKAQKTVARKIAALETKMDKCRQTGTLTSKMVKALEALKLQKYIFNLM